LAFITDSTCLTTSGLVSDIRAMRSAISGCSFSGRLERTWAARVVWRLAMTSAVVCGDSLRRKVTTCSGGVLRRNSKGRFSMTLDSRPMISAARSGPRARSSTSRA
jgi:hypothetical protein